MYAGMNGYFALHYRDMVLSSTAYVLVVAEPHVHRVYVLR